ncbi:hypothetical protein CHS0354_031374 [Potamilus streckersoni]|uniref:Secreted protein n=1 Tax=Potamilus streckersoni TaxID=2493646 RepID=A0AAE0SJW9_9BIVA|nr:hypothetical protein CHS0354_031374 [Potamilus streckersoni]
MDTLTVTVVTVLCIFISSSEVYSQNAGGCIDASGIVQDGQTCVQLITSFSGICYDTIINNMCCQTCNNNGTGIQGCEFGDHAQNCNVNLCSQYPDPTLCCGTCKASQ